MPILGLLGLLFAGAKLFGFIDWSWWLVLLPIYGPAIIALVIGLVAFVATAAGIKRL